MEIGVAIAKPATASTPASNRVLIRVSPRVIALLSNVPRRARFPREIHPNGGRLRLRPRMDADSSPPRMFLNQTNADRNFCWGSPLAGKPAAHRSSAYNGVERTPLCPKQQTWIHELPTLGQFSEQ